MSPIPTFAVAQLHDVVLGPDVTEYLARIDATLVPFGGRFLVHGAPATALEGAWSGDLVIIEFPDRPSAEEWYRSPAYQAILPLRTRNARSTVVLVDAVPPGHRAPDVLAGPTG